MPNHVTSRVIVTGSEKDLEALRDRVLTLANGVLFFDFNTLIPMPEEIKETEESNVTEYGLAILGYIPAGRFTMEGKLEKVGKVRALKRLMTHNWGWTITSYKAMEAELLRRWPDCVEKGKVALACFKKHGHSSWYSWCVENWGTKWNSYEYQEVTRSRGRWEFTFQTAWTVPTPVLETMFAEFPMLNFAVHSFDEGWNFASTVAFVAGTIIEDREYDGKDTPKAVMNEMHELVYGYPPEDDEEEDECDFNSDRYTPVPRAANIILPDLN